MTFEINVLQDVQDHSGQFVKLSFEDFGAVND